MLPFPPPGELPNPGIKPRSLALSGAFFITEPPGKPPGKPTYHYNELQFLFIPLKPIYKEIDQNNAEELELCAMLRHERAFRGSENLAGEFEPLPGKGTSHRDYQ